MIESNAHVVDISVAPGTVALTLYRALLKHKSKHS